ncbi:MAG: alkaline phosphatase family protein [Dehalococcoidia bacterium]|nr:alkaline phosphatase family protein [Dehalococcoidia bacterium]
MARTTILVMIDGLDPEYLDSCPAPNLRRFAEEGFRVTGGGMMPSVTNVNNTSMVTGHYPDQHGIVSNYWLDREAGIEQYVESGEFICADTIFSQCRRQGGRSLLAASKDKLRRLLGTDTDLAFSSEQPTPEAVAAAGDPPHIYSLEVNGWTIDSARAALRAEHYDLAFIATTDYAMHAYGPDHPESARHVAILDEALGRLAADIPDVQLLITADHGMSDKRRMLHLPAILAGHGIGAQAVPIIKDLYVVHHSNLGGCIYVHLDDPAAMDDALAALREADGVEEALPREEASARFQLMGERIGDILVTGTADAVFGDPAEVTLPPGLRSHGSMHERRVPIIGYGGDFGGFEFRENRDLGRYVSQRVLG